jgi:hypothetical protein
MLDTLEMTDATIALEDDWEEAGTMFGDAGEPNNSDEARSTVILLHHLRILKLSMQDGDPYPLAYILKRIHAPSLDLLSVCHSFESPAVNGLASFLTRGDSTSRCRPTRVSLQCLATFLFGFVAMFDLLTPES